MYRWARGEPLSKVLASGGQLDAEIPAGDFVRWARQVVDLLGQLAEAAGPDSPLRETARMAVRAVRRGILAYRDVD
jgi:ATP-dependent RNA helicase HelY